MDHASHNKIVSFIWSIADDCLRDVFVRGKYRDVQTAQVLHYLKATGFTRALLINFATPRLEYKRFINSQKHLRHLRLTSKRNTLKMPEHPPRHPHPEAEDLLEQILKFST